MGIHDRGYYQDDEWKQEGSPGAYGAQPRSMVTTLIIINLVVFGLDLFSPKVPGWGESQWVSTTLALKTSAGLKAPEPNEQALRQQQVRPNYQGPFENPLYFWQIFTYGFAHASAGTPSGIFHILFNMIALFVFGRAVEQRYGPEEFLKFYLIAIVVAGLFWLLSHVTRGSPASAVGASGAVVAVTILFVLNFPRQVVYLMGVLPVPAWVVGVLIVGSDLFNSIDSHSRVAWEAHMTGAAFAAAYFFGKWHFRWIQWDRLREFWKRKPHLRIHRPDDDRLSKQADEILAKIHDQGEESLTARERKILERYSKTMRKDR